MMQTPVSKRLFQKSLWDGITRAEQFIEIKQKNAI